MPDDPLLQFFTYEHLPKDMQLKTVALLLLPVLPAVLALIGLAMLAR